MVSACDHPPTFASSIHDCSRTPSQGSQARRILRTFSYRNAHNLSNTDFGLRVIVSFRVWVNPLLGCLFGFLKQSKSTPFEPEPDQTGQRSAPRLAKPQALNMATGRRTQRKSILSRSSDTSARLDAGMGVDTG